MNPDIEQKLRLAVLCMFYVEKYLFKRHTTYSVINNLNNKTKYFVLRWFDEVFFENNDQMKKLRERDLRESAKRELKDC